MRNREKIVGFDRTIQLNWIESAVEMLLQEKTPDEIWVDLDNIIKSVLNGVDARRKCKTVIFRTWIKVPDKEKAFRDEALKLIQRAQPLERLAIHWGMCCIAYPYFRDINGIIGKMLKFQDEIDSQQLIRRAVEIYGERETVIRSTQRLIATLRNWQVIDDNEEKAIISRKNQVKIGLSDRIQSWVIESMLRASEEQSMPASLIKQHSSYYPFEINPQAAILNLNPRLEASKLAGIEDVVWIKY